MSPDETARQLEQVARDLDLAVFALERPPREGVDPDAERRSLRRTLEQLRDEIERIARAVG